MNYLHRIIEKNYTEIVLNYEKKYTKTQKPLADSTSMNKSLYILLSILLIIIFFLFDKSQNSFKNVTNFQAYNLK